MKSFYFDFDKLFLFDLHLPIRFILQKNVKIEEVSKLKNNMT